MEDAVWIYLRRSFRSNGGHIQLWRSGGSFHIHRFATLFTDDPCDGLCHNLFFLSQLPLLEEKSQVVAIEV